MKADADYRSVAFAQSKMSVANVLVEIFTCAFTWIQICINKR